MDFYERLASKHEDILSKIGKMIGDDESSFHELGWEEAGRVLHKYPDMSFEAHEIFEHIKSKGRYNRAQRLLIMQGVKDYLQSNV